MEHFVLNQYSFVRNIVLKTTRDLTPEQALVVPSGHNNNILWQLGHILVVQEKFAFGFLGESSKLPEHYQTFFGGGSKPADWQGEPPSLSEVLGYLESQLNRILNELSTRLEETLQTPYKSPSGFELNVVKEVISFSLYHEGMHIGIIKDMKRLL